MSFFGFGGSPLKIHISLKPDSNSLQNGSIVQIDHSPTWKVRKNPFSSLKNFKEHNQLIHSDVNDNSTVVSDITSMTLADSSMEREKEDSAVYVYDVNEDIEGLVNLYLPPGKKTDHMGIKMHLFGRIELTHAVADGRPTYDFMCLMKELSPPGTIYQNKTSIPFKFSNLDKQYESYRGRNVNVRYFLRVVVERKFFPPIEKEHDIIVQIRGVEPVINDPIKMEVGIEECLHIEFEYQKKHYHLQDVILGKINFLLVRIKIKHMELAVIRRETCGEGVAQTLPGGQTTVGTGEYGGTLKTENQSLIKYEIMDGAPVKGETIPVRLYLKGIPADLTPTYGAGMKRFSVRYYLNLVLVDEEDRRYFKQQEVIFWRKDLG